VRTRFGRPAAVMAALFLALSPINVAVDRSNNTDSCLVLMLVLAAWAASRAAELASPGRLALSMAILGIAFNVKMLAGLIVAPSLMLAYLVGTRGTSLARRAGHMAVAGGVLAAVSLAWSAAYDLTPREQRPYVSSSTGNSMLELALLYNGLRRFAAIEAGDGQPAATAPLYDTTPTGPLRLATPHLAAQVAWLAPLALAGMLLGARRTLTAAVPALVLWSGWAITDVIVYSTASGVFHPYYLATTAPPLAALAGIGVAGLLAEYQRGRWTWLPCALLLTAAWQAYVQYRYVAWAQVDWRAWMFVGMLLAVGGAALGLAATRRAAALAVPLALLGLLVTPAAWALSTVLVPTNVTSPKADVAALVAPSRPWAVADRTRLLAFLRDNRDGERFALAMPNALQAAPLIVRSGLPVMAMGGYLGTDPILTPADLAGLVERRELRFVMLGGYSLRPTDLPHQQALAAWVRAHGKPVDAALWRGPVSGSLPPGYYSRPELYDFRPR